MADIAGRAGGAPGLPHDRAPDRGARGRID